MIAHVRRTSPEETSSIIDRAASAFNTWRTVPAPGRGKLVRAIAEELRVAKEDLGRLVTLETGKIISEGLGEVQEMIDICDFAVGLSRQLTGAPCVGACRSPDDGDVASARGLWCHIRFDFPVAVWSWNAALAVVCGDPVVWKPSEKAPLSALATHALATRALRRFGEAPEGLFGLLIGGRDVGEALVDDHRVAVVSATGSTAMGRTVGPRLAARFARAILELGGNNAAIVAPSADIDLAISAIAFAAMGTTGQRCTTLRRLFVHDSVYDALVRRLSKVYTSAKVGDPREAGIFLSARSLTGMHSRACSGRSRRLVMPAAWCEAASA